MKSMSLKLAVSVTAALILTSCSGGSSGGSRSTMSISGVMGGLSRSASATSLSAAGYIQNQVVTAIAMSSGGTGENNGSLAANQCADGAYYRVLCTAWSSPPVSAYGEVACGGATSGSFTVSGLPLDTDLTCAVRKSSDGASFVPFANLELPAASLSGGTATINADGDIALSISVSASGDITTTVTSGDNKADDNASAVVNAAGITGFYNLSCPSTASAADQVKCKCFLFESASYQNKEACIAANAAAITDTAFTINLNVYEGTVQTGGLDMNGDGTSDLAAGANIYAGTIWGAEDTGSACTVAAGCSSMKTTAAEGLPTFAGAISWTLPNVQNAIPWTTVGAQLKCGTMGGTTTVTIPAVPNSTATQTDWVNWLVSVVDAYDGVAACTTEWQGCNAMVAVGSRHLDKFCVTNFANSVLRESNVTLPRINIDWSTMCNDTGCGGALDPSAILVEGIDFDGSGATQSYLPSPQGRFVIDQFLPNSAGTGGALQSKSEYTQTYPCSTLAGAQSCHNSSAANGFLECKIGEELHINFMPSGTAGIFNTVFESTEVVRGGRIRGGTMEGTYTRDGYSQCVSVLDLGTSVPSFLARATKLN